MNPHFFTAPFYFAFIWFKVQGSRGGFTAFLEDGILVSQPSPWGILEDIRIVYFVPLVFMPLEPYPARCARHLPHAGKALSIGIVFPHMHVFALSIWG